MTSQRTYDMNHPCSRAGRRWLGAILGLLAAAPGLAAIEPGDLTIRLEPVATGLTGPVLLTHAGDGSGRLFIVDQSGPIWILKNGVRLATPFLDLSAEIPALNPGFDERGVLGLAFHPDYENNGRFFVRYSRPRPGIPGEPCLPGSRGCHEEVLAEFAVSADPDVANPAPTILFRIDEPQFNHNAGTVEFGPDGFLYFSLGDGGGANDGLADAPPSHGPIGNGQNRETALGTLLRVDVDSGAPYTIPGDNPFVGADGLDEIYAYGLRNPFRFSFDDGPGGDGTLVLADVGQALFEEINLIVKGGNYGWVIREGLSCFDPFNPGSPPASCATTGPHGEPLLDPIVDYSHAEGGISIIGGFVYRGTRSPALVGKYVFGDFSDRFAAPGGRLYYLDALLPGEPIREFRIGPAAEPYGLFLKGFGEDESGEIYVLGSTALGPIGSTGVVERLVVEPTPALDIRPGACPNPLNVDAAGRLTMALLGTETFDAARVDRSTLRLRRTDPVVAFSASLDGDQANAGMGTGSTATGRSRMTLDRGTNQLTMDLSFEGLLGEQTNQHIHGPATRDQSAGVLVPIPGPGAFEGFTVSLGEATKQVLLDGFGYINVHSTRNLAGEIRGQIEPAGVAPLSARLEDVGSPFGGEECGCHDAGGDGLLDLVLQFDMGELVAALGLDLADGGDIVPLTVTGGLLPHTTSDTVVYTFPLRGVEEVPANRSPGTGSCTVILDAATGEVSVSCTYAGLESAAFASHIHGLAPPGMNAGVIIPLVASGGTAGTITGGGALSPERVEGMLAGQTYVNLHTATHTGGELRGQIAGGGSFQASDCVLIVPPIPCEPLPGEVTDLELAPTGTGELSIRWSETTDASGYLVFETPSPRVTSSTVTGTSVAPWITLPLASSDALTFYTVVGFGRCGLGPGN